MLKQIYNSKTYNTDKQTTHSYISHLYSDLFDNKYETIKKVLEIGVQYGGSVLLWRDYFLNAEIYCLDIETKKFLLNEDRVIFKEGNAYTNSIKDDLPNDFDIIIDDGPHTLDSMIYFVENYVYKINNSGMLIIEDIQSEEWISILVNHLDRSIFKYQVFDLRSIRSRYDDLALVIEQKASV